MAATKTELMSNVRAKLAAAGRPTTHFNEGATDLDQFCDAVAEFVADNSVAGGSGPAGPPGSPGVDGSPGAPGAQGPPGESFGLGVNVMDHGAVADGITNDKPAIDTAIAAALAAGERRVFLPPGNYFLSSTLSITTDDVELYGRAGLSKLTSSAAGYAVTMSNARGTLRDLEIVKSTSSFGASVYISANADDCNVVGCKLTSGYNGVQIGDTNGTRTPLRATVQNCTVSSPDSCIFSRYATADGVEKAYHRILDNQVTQTSTRPGIEMWTGASIIRGNRVRSPSFIGGTGGITVGSKPYQQIIGNYVEGFTFGIEVGNTGEGIQIDDNTCVSCGTGISVSTIGGVKEEAVAFGNNVVIMTSSFTGGNQECIDLTGCRTATVVGGTLMYKSTGDFTSAGSRACAAIQANNDVQRLSLVGVQMSNLDRGIKAGSLNSNSGHLVVDGCSFENVKYPIDDTGGSPVISVVASRFSNCYHAIHNYRASYVGCQFTRSSTHPAVDKGFATFYEPLPGVATVRSCQFTRVLDTTFVVDGDRALSDGSYKRPKVELRDNFWVVGNVTTWAGVQGELATAGLSEPIDVPIHTWSSDLSFVKTREGVIRPGQVFAETVDGLVPAPGAGVDDGAVLHKDGTWRVPGTTTLPSLQQKQAIVSYISTSSDDWDTLAAMAAAGTLAFCLMNPNNGPGYRATFEAGGSSLLAWTSVITPITDEDVPVFGYVSTNYNDGKPTSNSHKGAGSVGANYRFTAATNDEITVVTDGTTTLGGAPGSAQTMTFPAGFGPIGVKSWYSGGSGKDGTTLPGGLALSTSYWLRPTGSTPIATYTLHTSYAGAIANTGKVDITSTGGGSGNGPFWFGLRRDDANVATSICYEMTRLVTLYPMIGGWFFDECDVDEIARDGAFDAIIAYRDANHPGLKLCMNGTPHSAARAALYDSFMLENTWANFESGAEPVPSWVQDGTISPFKCWACVNNVVLSPTIIADAVEFFRAKNVGLLHLGGTTFSRLPTTGSDGFSQADVDAAIAAGNSTPVADEVTYGALCLSGGAHTPAGGASYTKLNATSTAGELQQFTHTSPHRLTYTGSETKTVALSFQVSFKKASGTAADITMRPVRSGTTFSGVKISKTVAATDTGYQTLGMDWVCTLAPGQYLEIYVSSSNTDVLTVFSGSLVVAPI